MISGTNVIKTLVAAAVAISCLAVPAHSQGFSKMRGASGPPVDTHPKVDEKAYKAALDRIPAPSQKYDPWGDARSSEAPKTSTESNQGRLRETP